MKIALFGYGKMGKEIEKIALERGHEIVLKIKENQEYDVSKADIGIDFSVPNAALNNIVSCFKNNVPVISGTTGWLDDLDKALTVCKENKGSFIYASNFSLGVNIFFELNKSLAKMMKNFIDYNVELEEIHHKQKLDAPSGTAITLAEGVIENSDYNSWELAPAKDSKKLKIIAKRYDNVPGTHTVNYNSKIDQISLTHTAHNRKGFALGAVVAAEWIIGKKGVYTMNDVLNIK